MSKQIPHEGSCVTIEAGEGTVVDLNIIKQTVVVEINESKNRVEVPISAIKKIVKTKVKTKKEEEQNINLDSDVIEDTKN